MIKELSQEEKIIEKIIEKVERDLDEYKFEDKKRIVESQKELSKIILNI